MPSGRVLDIPTPRWAVPLLPPARYKGAHGGRGSGKSHFYAEALVERSVLDPNLDIVCVREVQRTLKNSVKKLIDGKIAKLGVGDMFESSQVDIKNNEGKGQIIFTGMQDHTADSIKSLEGFGLCLVEEAQSLSQRSIDLLLPTIRMQGSEIWFAWNPDKETDPVDQLLRGKNADPDAVVVQVNYWDNPFFPDTLRREMEKARIRNPGTFDNIWKGGYATSSDAQIFKDKWRVMAFEAGKDWDGPYCGLDFGFSVDPMAATKSWVYDDRLWIEYDASKTLLELDDTVEYIDAKIPGFSKQVIRADSARPDSISYLKRKGMARIVPCEKGKGSVEDGIEYLRSYKEIIIHPRCTASQHEAVWYKYKVDRLTGDVLTDIVDKDNHCWDALRYAHEPLMKRRRVDYSKIV